jgi:ABC-type lipoprotein release transport system permease subunit
MRTLKLMVFWGKVAFLFLFRSVRTTGTLSLMLLTAVAALIFLSALAVGVNDAMIRNSVSLSSGHITGYGIPDRVSKTALQVQGVAAVLKRLSIPGSFVTGNKTHEATLTEMEPREEFTYTAIGKKLVAGRFLTKGKGQLLIGQSLARKLEVRCGDKVLFAPSPDAEMVPLQVAGIYCTGIDQLDGENAFCPLGSVSSPGTPWSAAVFLEQGVSPARVIATYQHSLPTDCQFKSWETLMPDLKQLIDLNYVSMSIVILLVFGVVSLGIACAFVIVILKTLREYGILKAMGVTSRETVLLIVSEVVLMNLFATTLGVFFGIVAALVVSKTGIDLSAYTSHNRYFAVSGVIYPRLTVFAWGVPPALAFLFSLIAAIWPAVLVAHRRAAEILRTV